MKKHPLNDQTQDQQVDDMSCQTCLDRFGVFDLKWQKYLFDPDSYFDVPLILLHDIITGMFRFSSLLPANIRDPHHSRFPVCLRR